MEADALCLTGEGPEAGPAGPQLLNGIEREPVRDNGGIDIRLNPYARKDSGSFYTPPGAGWIIIDRTLSPLVEERLGGFQGQVRRPQERSPTEGPTSSRAAPA